MVDENGKLTGVTYRISTGRGLSNPSVPDAKPTGAGWRRHGSSAARAGRPVVIILRQRGESSLAGGSPSIRAELRQVVTPESFPQAARVKSSDRQMLRLEYHLIPCPGRSRQYNRTVNGMFNSRTLPASHSLSKWRRARDSAPRGTASRSRRTA